MKAIRIFGGLVLVLISGVVLAQGVAPYLTYQGRLADDAGLPVDGTVEMGFKITSHQFDQDVVADEPHTLAGTTAEQLTWDDLVPSSETVTTISGSTVYTEGVDYQADYPNGTIQRLPAGSIPDPGGILIDYTYNTDLAVLWSETISSVEVTNGIYHVTLGEGSTFGMPVVDGVDRFLEVIVEGERLDPRQRITTVMFAFKASIAEWVYDDAVHESTIQDGAVTSSKIQDGTIESVDIQDNSLTGDDIQDLSITGADILDDSLGVDQIQDVFVLNTGDTVTGPLRMYGSSYGAYAFWDSDPADHYAYLGSQDYGIYARAGASGETGNKFGGRFSGYSDDQATGAYGIANGYGPQVAYGVRGMGINYSTGPAYGGYFSTASNGTGPHYGLFGFGIGNSASTSYGVRGQASNSSTGDTYGGYFYALTGGTGTHYGVYATAVDYAGWFQDGSVHIGDAGVEDYATSDGDLYVEDALEVDGIAYFSGGLEAPGAIDASDVSFNYAGSSSQGGPADDLSCTDCLNETEIQDIYVLNTGDTVTGDLGVEGNMYIGGNIQDRQVHIGDAGGESYMDGDGDLYVEDELEVDGNAYVGLDLTVTGGNIGLGIAPNASYGILNDLGAAPTYGARIYGTSEGIRGALSSDQFDHYGLLGSTSYGVYARSGNSDETGSRYGGNFYAYTQSLAYGIYARGYGYGASSAYGVRGYGYNSSTGPAYGGYFATSNIGTGTHHGVYSEAQSDLSSTTGMEARGYTFGGTSRTVYGVKGYASNATEGPAYGGHFSVSSSGTGDRYGVYAESDSNSSTPNYGVYGTSANYGGSDTYGGYFEAENTGGAGTKYGVYGKGVGYGVYGEANATGVYGTGVNYGVQGRSSGYGGRFEHDSDPSIHYASLGGYYYGIYARSGSSSMTSDMHGGRFYSYTQRNSYGVRAYAYGYSDSYPAYGVHGYADNTGTHRAYGGYFETGSTDSGNHYGVYALGVGDSDTSWIYGVYGRGTNNGDYPAIGGYFYASSSGTGSHIGVYGFGSGSSGTASVYGGYFQASDGSSNSTVYGVYASAGGGSHNDALYAASGDKHWVNPDPDDPAKSIVYTTLEGWESGTYFRGKARLKNGKAVITLPDHFRKVTSPDSEITVQVTPRSMDSQGLAVIKSSNSEIIVGELYGGKGDYEFDYLVQGVRLGYEDHQTIIDNIDYVPFQNNQSVLDESDMTTQEWYDNQSEGLKKIFKKNGTLKADGKVNEDLFKAKGWKLVKVKKVKD